MEGSSNTENGNAVSSLTDDAVSHSLSGLSIMEDGQDHAFWDTQPMAKYAEASVNLTEGPVEPAKDLADIRHEPYNLPSSYEWSTCDLQDNDVLGEVYTLLTNNYVEDDDNMFRFDYSRPFLKWALQPPGYLKDWHVGVRVKASQKLVAFITGVPAGIRVRDRNLQMAEVNFLCVHKKLRSKRLAPVLIKEITRRVHLRNIWQAAYTGGALLPTPIARCQYWHRSLNPKKLIDVGFSRLAPRMTMNRTIKLYKLPEHTTTPGLRTMELRDVPAVTKLLTSYLAQFVVAPVFTEFDVEHVLMPLAGVVESMVVENPLTNEITDFCSFYALPSSIIGNATYSTLKAAYSFYNVANSTPLLQLMSDMLIVAKQKNYDVFNALDLMQNASVLKDLKFGPGDGYLHYYLYNYQLTKQLGPSQLGLVLL